MWAERRAIVGEPAAVAMVSLGRQAADIMEVGGGVGGWDYLSEEGGGGP